jgi:hypothetical protein
MQLDIYRRHEPEHKRSFMAVPAGKPIPPEVDDLDWKLVATATEMDVEAPSLAEYAIDHPGAQIREKGYAITSLSHQLQDDD